MTSREITPEVDCLLSSKLPMPASDSVAAIIMVDHTKYLLQQRDLNPAIYYPGHWGLFGGAVERGETPDDALRRELHEELGLSVLEITPFTEFNFDLSVIGEPRIFRRFYEVPLSGARVGNLQLTEGASMGMYAPRDLFQLPLTPYDSFAIWLHYMKRG